jgi:hypothetical protein
LPLLQLQLLLLRLLLLLLLLLHQGWHSRCCIHVKAVCCERAEAVSQADQPVTSCGVTRRHTARVVVGRGQV